MTQLTQGLKAKYWGKNAQTIKLKAEKIETDETVWCKSVLGEKSCHPSPTSNRALLITLRWNKTLLLMAGKQMRVIPDGPRGTEDCPAQLSVSA